MVSQTFSLGEESRKGICTKILLLVVLAAVVAAAVLAGIYAFRSTGQSGESTVIKSVIILFFLGQTANE